MEGIELRHYSQSARRSAIERRAIEIEVERLKTTKIQATAQDIARKFDVSRKKVINILTDIDRPDLADYLALRPKNVSLTKRQRIELLTILSQNNVHWNETGEIFNTDGARIKARITLLYGDLPRQTKWIDLINRALEKEKREAEELGLLYSNVNQQ